MELLEGTRPKAGLGVRSGTPSESESDNDSGSSTVMDTVAAEEVTVPSDTVNVKLSEPL